jgi:deazaflavin-dependent oxidoreductase (nitroreductase family)
MKDVGSVPEQRYLEPGWLTQNVFNRIVRGFTRMGLSFYGTNELRVRGRSTGEWRSVPVNLLTVDGVRYLVAPRGITQWVKNLRAAGGGELRVGRRVTSFQAEELADDVKAPILRAYLRKWKWEVGIFFDGLDADSSDERIAEVAPGFPVFRISEPA